MTISSTVRTAGPFTSGSSFAFAFKVFAQADVAVYRTVTSTGVVTTLALNTDYTVSLSADQDTNPGGTVTLNTALAAGQTLLIVSAVANTQSTDITNQSGFYPDVINDALDRATVQVQQVQGQANRGIRYPATEISLNAELPKASDRANQYLAFNSNGEVDIGGAVPDQRYYGAKTADPATRNDGSARVAGDLYYNSVANTMKVFNGSAWDTVTTTPVDGDKGDITLSGGASTYTIDNDVVTFAKMANIATDRLVGRDTASTGDPEALTVGGGIEFTGSGGIQTSAFTGDVTKSAGGTALTIANGAVTSAKLDTNIAISGTLNVTGAFTASGGLGTSLITRAASQVATSTAVTFTGIPSWANRITITWSNISTATNGTFGVQVGTSSGTVTSGYTSTANGLAAGVAYAANGTASFIFGSNVAADAYYGRYTLNRNDANCWIGDGMLHRAGATNHWIIGTGRIDLGTGVLDRVVLTSGGAAFDAGTFNVMWE